tara:strand:- start:2388 stop:2804 length:417 start_codon:yes stop_codon:yes gene_type:complete
MINEHYTIAPVRTLEELTDNKSVVEHYLRKALTKAPEYSLREVLKSIYDGLSVLWLIREGDVVIGAFTVKVYDYPNTRILMLHLLGGDKIEEWLHLLSKVEDYGRDLGCDMVEMHGRYAWKKLLPDYKSDRIILNKVL